ncbi:GNAT family N-acetyltransferase [Enterococcus sp. BWM-S5]|uniref:GNAT family N-acetyltransferase n=1 Tax=Enterococcus larvae TaxID=2794352 RepID=A0ABS4CF33_9ENTE|nr:GNAT family N-acetyltransferase [Enterococcus larvae]MBP1045034.1 GNAT family N-acetyltransferase [Enterococcus larvae]
MLDKSIPYHEIWMTRLKNEPVPSVRLPEGFRFSYYQKGDMSEWAAIEASVLEFDNAEEGLAYFEQAFAPFEEELAHQMLFIEDEAGRKVATCTAWWKDVDGQRLPLFHWLAVKPEAQRRGLAGALVSKATALLQELEPGKDIYLHTQTWSYEAIRLYERFGYQLIAENINGSKNESYQKAMEIIEAQNQRE